MRILFFMAFLLFSTNSFAARIQVMGAGTSSGGGAGNVGIGTTGRAVVQIGSTATGTPYNNNFDSNGNLGIGSASPGTALDVNGTTRASAFSGPLTGNVTGNVTGSSGSTTGNAGTATALAANGTNCSAGNYALGVDASGNSENCTAVTSSQWATQNTTDVSLAGGNVGVGTTKTTTSALTVIGGNVGVGTWIPAALLSVGTGSAFRVDSTGTIVRAGNGVVSIDNTGMTGTNSGSSVAYGNLGSGASSTSTITGGANANSSAKLRSTSAAGTTDFLTFQTGSQQEAMRIDTNRNVGIGSYGANTNFHSLGVVGNVGIGTGYSSSYIGTVAPSGGMIVEGNVGIGTVSPTQALVLGSGTLQTVGIGTTVPQLPCIKANRVWGYYDPPWIGACT